VQPERKIIRNVIRCRKCGDVLESVHRHDFKKCGCGCAFNDGGNDYLRRGWNPQEGTYEECVEDLSEYGEELPSSEEILRERGLL
jgi:hypothetical protein